MTFTSNIFFSYRSRNCHAGNNDKREMFLMYFILYERRRAVSIRENGGQE